MDHQHMDHQHMDTLNIATPNKTDYRIELYHMYLYDYAVHMIYAFQQHMMAP